MKHISYLLILTFVACCLWQCSSSKKATAPKIDDANNIKNCKNDSLRIGFYNVENLFDLFDNPDKVADEDFTPEGKNEWTRKRLDKKINDLSKVIAALGGGNAPALLGLCEVENSLVLEELLDAPAFANGQFEYLHKDSPDRRGIDVCLVYDKEAVKIINWEAINLDFPNDADYTSRDIVYANVLLTNGGNAHIFINHWPSRYGGVEKSEPRRLRAAEVVLQKINSITAKNSDAKIILMGDFNDEATNKSLREVIAVANSKAELKTRNLYNAFSYMLSDTTKGTYNYRGKWSFLDQIIVSKNWLNTTQGFTTNGKANVLNEKWMLYFDKKTGLAKPNRTFGSQYYGGYSDHLPIYLDLICQ